MTPEVKIVNLTPHAVSIVKADGTTFTIPASGEVARVEQTRKEAGEIAGIKITVSEFGEVIGLPDPEPNTVYVVSGMVLASTDNRWDVFAPGELIRDNEGKVIGCNGLSAPAGYTVKSETISRL
jgi:ethanolamine ammonia-lyase small subunit